MSAHRAGTDRALARGDSRNVAELAHMTGRLRRPVRGMPLIGAARCPAGTKHAYGDGAQAILDEIAARLAPEDPQSARAKALGLCTLAVGTLQVSRVVSDPKVADEVLEQGIQNARMFLG
jgi:hypothetical protein